MGRTVGLFFTLRSTSFDWWFTFKLNT